MEKVPMWRLDQVMGPMAALAHNLGLPCVQTSCIVFSSTLAHKMAKTCMTEQHLTMYRLRYARGGLPALLTRSFRIPKYLVPPSA